MASLDERMGRSNRERAGRTRRSFAAARSDDGVQIEFLGLPGVGKTTLARGVAARLEQQGHRVVLPRDTVPDGRIARLVCDLPLLARYAVHHPREVWESLHVLRAFPRPGLGKLRQLREWSRMSALAEEFHTSSQVAIFDEGFYQRILAMAWRTSATPAAIHAAVAATPPPEGLVVLKAPLHVVFARFSQRPRSRSHLTLQQRLETPFDWEQLVEMFREVENAILACRHNFVIEYVAPSTEGVEASCDSISRYLDEYLRMGHYTDPAML